MSKRQVVLDTETTGMNMQGPVNLGHRVIEIGAVSLLDRGVGETFHTYLKCDRPVDPHAHAVHGISDAFLEDKPTFAQMAPAFFSFIEGAELIIHNAPFDLAFLNAEFALLQTPPGPLQLEQVCSVVDTLRLARSQFPGRRNTLDALCKRFYIDLTGRALHGALLDAHLLVSVYLAMTGGQCELSLPSAPVAALSLPSEEAPPLVVTRCSEEALARHEDLLEKIASEAGRCAWKSSPVEE